MRITTARRNSSIFHLLIHFLFAYAALADVLVSPYDPVALPFIHVRAVGPPGGGGGGGGGGRGGSPGGGGRGPPGTGNPGTGRKPQAGSRPNKIELKDLPPSAHIDDAAESKPFNVGNYRNKPQEERVLFNSFQGPDRAFFLKMMDIFGTTPGYLSTDTENIYEGLPSAQQRPFDPKERPDGKPINIRPNMNLPKANNNPERNFNPVPATAACEAFLSVYTYCLDGGDPDMDCACYSSTYYVPDQFNGMASRCAKATATGCRQGTNNDNRGGADWCDVAKTVAPYANYCTADDGDVIVKFGARIKGEPTSASPGSKSTRRATPTEDDDDDTPAVQTTPAAQRSTTVGQGEVTSTPRITPGPTSRPSVVLSFIPTPRPSTTSFSGAASRPFDRLAAGLEMWVTFGLSLLVAFS